MLLMPNLTIHVAMFPGPSDALKSYGALISFLQLPVPASIPQSRGRNFALLDGTYLAEQFHYL
jgi:hypothetical protein